MRRPVRPPPAGAAYLREPRCGFFNCDWRLFSFFRLGLVMLKVPLP